MKRLVVCLFVSISMTLAGCVTPPKSTDELRNAVKGGMVAGSRSEVFTVNRPYRRVVDDINKNWSVCLSKVVTFKTDTGRGQQYTDVYRFNPGASVKETHAELTLQQQRLGRQAVLTGGELPDAGFYAVVFDIDAVGRDTTRVNMQKLPMTGVSFETLMKAGRIWAEGKNMGCPDLSQ